MTEKVQTLEKAVKILECFTRDKAEMGVREVARQVALSTSATGRLMLSMRELGLLSQDPTNRNYRLGPRVLTWAGTYLFHSDIRNVAYPLMQDLHRKTQETISLYLLDGNERVCIERLESTQNLRFVAPRVGLHLPLHAGSAGKVLLAYLPEKQQNEILNRGDLAPLTSKTIVDPNKLRKELEMIRQNGYAISTGEWILEASGVAAPIFDRGGEIVAALAISGPSQRFEPQVMENHARCLVEAAAQVSRSLGFVS